MFCLFSCIRSASQDVIQPTWWTLTRKFLMLPIILIVIAYNRANLGINCWCWYHHALVLVWLFNKHEASAISLLMCSRGVCVKVAYDCSTALYLCLCLYRPGFHWSKLRQKHKHKHKKNELSVFLVLMLMLMSRWFSLVYTCACVCAYAYALVKNEA